MKTAALFFLVLMIPASALADGFICHGDQSGIEMAIYNQVNPHLGTRNPAVLVISDPALATSNHTEARFSPELNNFRYEGHGNYVAEVHGNVFLFDSTSVAGHAVNSLNEIRLKIVFSYDKDAIALVDSIDEIPGTIEYTDLNNQVSNESASCSRYRKHAAQ